MIGILDYGMSNLGSVANACEALEIPSHIIDRPEEMDDCSALILPGQGAFGDCMHHIDAQGFSKPIVQWIREGRPYLGICIGLQILFESSEEAPGVPGLGVLEGKVVRFDLPHSFKIPQMGWNRVKPARAGCPLWDGLQDGAYFYFVHSFHVEAADPDVVAGHTEYGVEYTSAVYRGNLFAVQFHPEKSQRDGLRVLRNFADCFQSMAL